MHKLFAMVQLCCCIADPEVVRHITVRDFSNWKDRYMPTVDQPLLSGKAQEMAQSQMIVAK